jgi:hypothetical protein
MLNYFSQPHLMKPGFAIMLMLASSSSFSAEDNMDFGVLSASKSFTNGYTLVAVTGGIHEEFKGKIAYLGVAKKTDSGVVWEAGYFGYYPKQDDGGYHEEHRLRGSLSYAFKLDGWTLMHRSRVEYRTGQTPNGFRYRPALELSRVLSTAKNNFTPYIEAEPFYDFRVDKITLSLLTAGVKWPVSSNIILNIGYMNMFLTEGNRHVKGPLIGIHIKL